MRLVYQSASANTQFRLQILCGLLMLFVQNLVFAQPRELVLESEDGAEINVSVYPAGGSHILIWHPHEVGTQAVDQQLALHLSQQGIEVWLVELLPAYFLANTASSMDRVPEQAYARVIQAAHQQSNKQIVAAASGRAVIPLLRGVRYWQSYVGDDYRLAGIILLSPKMYVETPDPGQTGVLMPIITATNIPIILMQPDKSPWFWKLRDTVPALERGGSEVHVWRLWGLRDRFYFRPDAFENERMAVVKLFTQLRSSIRLLSAKSIRIRQAVASMQAEPPAQQGKKQRALAPYQGNPQPPPLRLPQLNRQIIDLVSLKGQVVLVNFWASWCPPCVHEMPSMQRLKQHFKDKPFSILGVNMAEDEATIKRFLQSKVNVDFPIVMDRSGSALQAWQVFAFPTSYVINKQGKIHYALFGGVEWDDPDIINKIQALIESH